MQFHSKKVAEAPIITANNDVKCNVNRKRSKAFAWTPKLPMAWAVAKDQVTSQALRDEPALPPKKKEWLQRHDQECGGLYGLLPLVKGLPVALTDHIDRNPDKRLLRGKVGHIHSWILHSSDQVAKQRG